MLRLGSLCSGYGGLDMAVSAHYGADLAWVSEIDKDCARVLEHWWGHAPNLGDLTRVDWTEVEPVDVICAGFPCQPFSHAGKREGSNDERAIFSWIADAIGVLRPRYVVLENVTGLLSLGGPGVVGTLAGLGYVGRAGVVSARAAGAPHLRQRWFCIATDADGSGRGEQRRAVAMEPEQRPAQRGRGQTEWAQFTPAVERWEGILGRPAPAPTVDGKLSSRAVEWMMGLPDGHVCALGLSRTAELKMLGNGVVPAQAALALELLS